jgi:hypothetical protein
MNSDIDKNRIERELRDFDREIEEMHTKVSQYLSDRSKYPFPQHSQLISKILNYDIKGVKSRQLQLMLEKVQFKARNREQIWKKWFEER